MQQKTAKKPDEITVFISLRDSVCAECGEDLGHNGWITLTKDKRALCLVCADLDHLVYLPAGDAALTRRAKAYSKLYAVVVKWSRARKRYERQGILVEEDALAQAEAECLADQEARERRRAREAEKRAEFDQTYLEQFATHIRTHFSKCPKGREFKIAEHACRKYSGRIGRTAVARQFDEEAINLAVAAHVRHRETEYDELLGLGYDRYEARAKVADQVAVIMEKWRGNLPD